MSAVAARPKGPHPIIWTLLYVPFGGLSGFASGSLMALASDHGISVSDGALIGAATLLTSWMKWLWAPIVDVTLSPKRWYVISTTATALGCVAMALTPLNKEWLNVLLVIIAATSLINSIVGMAVEAMIATLTPPEEVGNVSGWFQAGNLGATAGIGALGGFLLTHFTSPAIAGLAVGAVFMACNLALLALPHVSAHVADGGKVEAVVKVARGLWDMVKTPRGWLTLLLCLLPVGTGAAQGTLQQAEVARAWGVEPATIFNVMFWTGPVTMAGCFVGGWICQRLNARSAYALFGITLAAVAVGMAFTPAMPVTYWGWMLIYAFGTGLAYAAFTAMSLLAVGDGPAATGYNVYASFSNFPIWWLGLLLGWAADTGKGVHHGPPGMLVTEAALGVVGVLVFFTATSLAKVSLRAATTE